MTEAGWTREKPTVEGFYWHIRTDLPPHVRVPGVLEIRKLDEGLRVYEPFGPNDVWHPLNEYGGLWMGPLAPTDRQQGRVEGLRDSMDDLRKRMDRDDGDTDNDVWKHLAWCELQIKAQAAQDEKGAGDGN